MAEMPTCLTCNKKHWRFTSCADAAAPKSPEPWQGPKSVPDGYRHFTDQLTTRDSNGWLKG